MATQKGRKNIFSLEEKLKISQDVVTSVSLSKQLGISVSTLNTIITLHIIEENAK
jgi:pyruvate formate-lyase activating enzyme-like uncharacterized protein